MLGMGGSSGLYVAGWSIGGSQNNILLLNGLGAGTEGLISSAARPVADELWPLSCGRLPAGVSGRPGEAIRAPLQMPC